MPLLLPKGSGGLVAREMEGFWLSAGRAAEELASFQLSDLRRYSTTACLWILAAKWVVEAIARQQVVPALAVTSDPNTWRASWRVAPIREEDRARLVGLAAAMPGVARCAPVNDDGAVWSPAHALQLFLDAAADGLLRTTSELTAPIPGQGPDWVVRLANGLGGPRHAYPVRGLHDSHLLPQLEQWIAPATHLGDAGRPLVGFRLAEPRSSQRPWVLSFHLYTASGERVSAADLAEPDPGLEEVIAGMVAPQDTLLEALGRCARVFGPISRSLTGNIPSHVEVNATEAWHFLTQAGLQLERAGYPIEVPAALSRVGRRRVRARMRIGGPRVAADEYNGSGLLAGLVNYKWEACLGEDTLTAKEFLELAKSKAPLVMHRGEWVAVDPEDVERLKALIGKGAGQVEIAEALRLALAGEVGVPEAVGVQAEVVVDGDVAAALETLLDGGEVQRDLPVPASLRGELRPYQQRGYAWLVSVTGVGFGACLADDMGLGKTIQLLALVAHVAEREPGARFLVVCPTSVVGNWRREIERFIPHVRSIIHHGSARSASVAELQQRMDGRDKRQAAIVITSYALARRDLELLTEIIFDGLILDEAQNIKNPDAAQSQAARQLVARRRVALTGTPVENRLTELWSIFDFLNPGLLGKRSTFKHQFAIPIERYGDENAANTLKRVTSPFIMRRMKTDPTIAPELPDKEESVRYCPLTREQASLYQATVDRTLDEIQSLGASMERRGRILAMITAIKQICNHPAHFLRDGVTAARRSGKLTRFLQLIDEVVDSDGHALVFTQYREMGDILEAVLSEHLGEATPFLHGGLSLGQRDAMVADFQRPGGPTAMVVSLRAGGTGLNLTRANHVFHYDRWWNPAVEDQATDRAFRIGQTRDVTVHRMVSQATLEEQIHQILEEKRMLADKVVGTDETWLSELDDDMLRSLMTLGADAVLEETW